MTRRVKPLSVSEVEHLDPNVRTLVQVVRALGYETTDSGDGSKFGDMDGALPFPHVCASLGSGGNAIHSAQWLHDRIAGAIRDDRKNQVRLAVEVAYSTADKITILTVLGISDTDLDPDVVTNILQSSPTGCRPW